MATTISKLVTSPEFKRTRFIIEIALKNVILFSLNSVQKYLIHNTTCFVFKSTFSPKQSLSTFLSSSKSSSYPNSAVARFLSLEISLVMNRPVGIEKNCLEVSSSRARVACQKAIKGKAVDRTFMVDRNLRKNK